MSSGEMIIRDSNDSEKQEFSTVKKLCYDKGRLATILEGEPKDSSRTSLALG